MSEHLMTRRNEVATALITLWVVTGLFLDGWAHHVDKPETFFTPWHGVLYSGFLVGALWSAHERARDRRLGLPPEPMPPAMRLGFALFAVGGVLDLAWHEAFGVEEDVEALLSPTHLMLMVGGLLLTTATVRSALARPVKAALRLPEFLPALAGVTLALAVVGFFLQFVSALLIEDHAMFLGTADDAEQVLGILGVLLTNVLFLGAAAWTLRHWPRPPAGTFTLMFTGAALMMSGLHAFDEAVLVLPFAAAGATADVLVARGRPARVVLTAVPVVLWAAWFAVYHGVWGLGWAVELWSGSIVFAALTGYALALLTAPVGVAATAAATAPEPAANGDPAGDVAGRGEGLTLPGLPGLPGRARVSWSVLGPRPVARS